MDKFKYKIYNFMQGRYGIDEFHKFLLLTFTIIWIINIVVKSIILYYFGFAIAIFAMFRLFSKNYEKRRLENEKYIKIKNKIIQNIKITSQRWAERKTHIYRKCPNCKAMVRLPKKKGKHTCTCPCCQKDFKVKS